MRKLFFISCLILLLPMALAAQTEKKKVMVMEIKAEIDPRMSRYVKLALEHAVKINADIIIIDMDTFGGALDDAKAIVDMLMDEKRPTWVFINADAASAGALISIACDSIYMSPGATIGAATVPKVWLMKMW
jgi:membrane-bound serine protease (ClpP class)